MTGDVLAPRRFLRLLTADALNVLREPLLMTAVVMSVVPAIVFAFTRQVMDDAAVAAFGIEAISRHVALVVLVLPAVLVGWVTGFLLLEDRDEGMLLAIDVTPVGKTGFLLYRVAITALIGGGLTAGAIPLVVPNIGVVEGLLLVGTIAAECVLAAIILPAVARNKVEGLALTKLTNIAAMVPLMALIPSPWRFLGGVAPPYWIGELLVARTPATPLWLTGAALLITHVGWGVLILRLMDRRVG
jgi:fluoroquinolone transport system permease protein